MYTATSLLDAIFGSTPLVGWRQEEDPAKSQLDTAVTTTISGRYFQEAHPLLTLENVFSIAPRFEDYVYQDYAGATAYVVGNIVSKGGSNWICIQAGTGQDPETSESGYWTAWTIGNQKSLWLKNKTRGYILGVFDDFLEQKKWGKIAKSIIEERAIFDGSQYTGETIASQSKIVGFEIRTALNMGILAKIGKVGLQFAGTGNITINLYHSSQVDAVQAKTVEITESSSMQWFDFNWDLPYLSTFDAGGTWTVEYTQDNAPGEAINKAKDWSAAPAYMNGYEYSSWKLWSQFLEFHPFTVAVADRANPARRTYEYTSNFGMNMIVSVHCDYTDFFIRQKTMFNNVLIKGVGKMLLREIALNPSGRINLSESRNNLSKDDLLYEIDGNTQGRPTGIGYEYLQALKAVQIDTQGLSRICLPCGRKGVKIQTI